VGAGLAEDPFAVVAAASPEPFDPPPHEARTAANKVVARGLEQVRVKVGMGLCVQIESLCRAACIRARGLDVQLL